MPSSDRKFESPVAVPVSCAAPSPRTASRRLDGTEDFSKNNQDTPSLVSPRGKSSSKSSEKSSSRRKKTERRPQYSRKYSTPPSRPLSPVGYPRALDIPDLDLNLSVDTAPQEPDIFDDPETDYFTSDEQSMAAALRHTQARSRRQPSQATDGAFRSDLNNAPLLPQITETELALPYIPGGFLGLEQSNDRR